MKQKDHLKKLAALGLASGFLLAGESGSLEAKEISGTHLAHNKCGGGGCGGSRPANNKQTALNDPSMPSQGAPNSPSATRMNPNASNPNDIPGMDEETQTQNRNFGPTSGGQESNQSKVQPRYVQACGSGCRGSAPRQIADNNCSGQRPEYQACNGRAPRQYAEGQCGGQIPGRPQSSCSGSKPRQMADNNCGGQGPARPQQACNGRAPRQYAQGHCGANGCKGGTPRPIAGNQCGGQNPARPQQACNGRAPRQYASACGGQDPRQSPHENYINGRVENNRFVADASGEVAPQKMADDKYPAFHLYTESELLDQLNDQGKALYFSLNEEGKTLAREIASQQCAGKNACQGRNICKTDHNACKGKGSCKGQSACGFSNKNDAVEIAAKKMAEKRAKAYSQ